MHYPNANGVASTQSSLVQHFEGDALMRPQRPARAIGGQVVFGPRGETLRSDRYDFDAFGRIL
jgi:hypothetical protein